LALLLSITPLFAATITVDDDGPANYSTIQAAWNAATDGDLILVAAGTYPEHLVCMDKSVTLKGAGKGRTIVDGTNSGRCLCAGTLTRNATTVVEGFTFTSGRMADGGGGAVTVCFQPVGHLVLRDCALTNSYAGSGGGIAMECHSLSQASGVEVSGTDIVGNAARDSGGGLFASGGNLMVSDSTIGSNTVDAANRASHYWGCGAGAVLTDCRSVTFEGSTIRNNCVVNPPTQLWWEFQGGGGVYARRSPSEPDAMELTFQGNTIEGNSGIAGGGLEAISCGIELVGNTIKDNVALVGNGGGLYLMWCPSAVVKGNTISGNRADNSGVYGGGLACYNGPLEFTDNIVADNSAGSAGGGGAGIMNTTDCRIARNQFTGNTTTYVGGGLLLGHWGRPTTVECNRFSGNHAGIGGGVCVDCGGSGLVYLVGNLVEGNTSDGSVGGIMTFVGTQTVLVNNTVVGNRPGGCAAGGATITNCVFYGNTEQVDLACQQANHCLVGQGSYTGTGNISADPLFVNAAAGDYHLQAGSPCIGAGDNSVMLPGALDLDGNVRIWPTGGTVDMGCYEYGSAPPVTNRPPTAVALVNGQDAVTVDEATPAGTTVALDGSQSSDPDSGDTLTYAWATPGGNPATGATAQANVTYPVGGPYTATLTVTDSKGLTATDSVTITVIPGLPANQLDNLGEAITAGVTDGSIAADIKTSLMSKVTAALTALAQNRPNDAKIAANNLKAFINEVRAQTDKKIDDATADALIARANQIIVDLGFAPQIMGSGREALVTNAMAIPTATGAQIIFTLSDTTYVSVDIVNIAGRPVRTISSYRGLLAGVNTVLWDGRSEMGTKAPNGTYLVRITAHGPNGTASQGLTTLRLTR
jgi:nitrous oxidase accessory protein NosD